MEDQGVHLSRVFTILQARAKSLRKNIQLKVSHLTAAPSTPISTSQTDHNTKNMQRRIDELERRVASLEAEKDQVGYRNLRPLREIWKSIILTGVTVFLAIVPSAWVIWNRWLSHKVFPETLRKWWNEFRIFGILSLPPYFLEIFACTIGVLLLVWLNRSGPFVSYSNRGEGNTLGPENEINRRQVRVSQIILAGASLILVGLMMLSVITHSIPGLGYALALLLYLIGWVLRDISVDQVRSFWERKKDLIKTILLVHLALLAFLTAFYTPDLSQASWIFGLVLILALIILFPYIRKVHPIFWIISFALILYTVNINAWWFAIIGDEYSFYDHVRLFAEGQPFSYIASHIFKGLAVTGTHPYMSTVIQYIFMQIFGNQNFGWRFSNLYLSAVSIGLFYYFFKTFLPRRVALLASFFLMTSHYLMTFGKVGYNNLQSYFALALVLAAATWTFNSRRSLSFICLGFTMGFCFYVYPAALYVAPLAILFLLFFEFPKTKNAIRHWALMLSSFFLLLFPLLLQQGYWEAKVPGTFFNNPDVTRSTTTIIRHYSTNLVYAFYSFLYNPEESHFLVYSDVDPLSGIFIFLGLAYLIKSSTKSRFLAFFLTAYVVFLILVGTSHDRIYPPNTRMFLFLPWWSLFAAVGVTWLLWQIRNMYKGQVSMTPYFAFILIGVLGINLYQSYPLEYKRWGPAQGIDYLYFRVATKAQKIEHKYPTNFVIVTDRSWGSSGFKTLQWVYGIPSSPTQLNEVVVDGPVFPERSRYLVEDARSLIIVYPRINSDWQAGLSAELQNMGKSVCDVKTNDGQTRFQMWYAINELAQLCK